MNDLPVIVYWIAGILAIVYSLYLLEVVRDIRKYLKQMLDESKKK